jgi:hypothetical protein
MRMKWLIPLLSMMLFSRIVDDGGAGGDEGGADDIGDFEIDDLDDDLDEGENGGEGGEDKGKKDDPPDEGTPDAKALEERLRELEERAAAAEQERILNEAISGIQKKYPDFDPVKIAEHLKKLPKEEQEMYNNPVGWELIHRDYFQRKDVSYQDPFDSGRGSASEPYDFEKAYERARSGDKKAIAEILERSV